MHSGLIINFNQQTGVHTFLVAHPTKMLKKENSVNFYVPNLYNISGSAHFFNITQNGFTVYRNYETNQTEVHIQKVKWEHLGKIGECTYIYNEDNARFIGAGIEPKNSWLAKKEINNTVKPNINFYEPITTESGDDLF